MTSDDWRERSHASLVAFLCLRDALWKGTGLWEYLYCPEVQERNRIPSWTWRSNAYSLLSKCQNWSNESCKEDIPNKSLWKVKMWENRDHNVQNENRKMGATLMKKLLPRKPMIWAFLASSSGMCVSWKGRCYSNSRETSVFPELTALIISCRLPSLIDETQLKLNDSWWERSWLPYFDLLLYRHGSMSLLSEVHVKSLKTIVCVSRGKGRWCSKRW